MFYIHHDSTYKYIQWILTKTCTEWEHIYHQCCR